MGHYFGTERGMKMARKRHTDEDTLKLLREIEVKQAATCSQPVVAWVSAMRRITTDASGSAGWAGALPLR